MSGQQLHFGDFNLVVLISALFCLGSYKSGRICLACRQHGGSPKSKSTKCSHWPDESPCTKLRLHCREINMTAHRTEVASLWGTYPPWGCSSSAQQTVQKRSTTICVLNRRKPTTAQDHKFRMARGEREPLMVKKVFHFCHSFLTNWSYHYYFRCKAHHKQSGSYSGPSEICQAQGRPWYCQEAVQVSEISIQCMHLYYQITRKLTM